MYFFESGTDTPLAVYSDNTLVTSIGTSIALNSAGRFATNVFLKKQAYKVVLKDSGGSTIWTADPVTGSDFLTFPKWTPYAGNPNGNVAGTAGSSGVQPDIVWDYSNSIQYVCTTTGVAAAAVWTAINASSATPSVPPPQGRLTLVSNTPVIVSDQASKTECFYTPYTGNLVPIYNGSTMVPTEFSELTLTLAAQHTAAVIYDIFVFSNSGVLTIATGPAWSVSTAALGDRGTGASTTELTRVKGLWVNAVAMTGRNGATTFSIGANLATYVGSIYIDAGAAGQVSCLPAYGASRKWGIWNAYNRVPIILKMGDATASWSYATATLRQSRATATNVATVFTGLPEEFFSVEFSQHVTVTAGGAMSTQTVTNGIGWNSTSAASGLMGNHGDQNGTSLESTLHARYVAAPALGINNVNSLEKGTGSNTNTWSGGEDDCLLTARWMG